MYADTLFAGEELDLLDLDAEEIIANFRDRYGDYHEGRFEEDPEMTEYEETVELAASLRRR